MKNKEMLHLGVINELMAKRGYSLGDMIKTQRLDIEKLVYNKDNYYCVVYPRGTKIECMFELKYTFNFPRMFTLTSGKCGSLFNDKLFNELELTLNTMINKLEVS